MLYFAPWKKVAVVGLCLLGILAMLPNFFPSSALERLPSWVPANHIVLGLDLQGGAHMLLSLDTEVLVQERLESLRGDIRQRLRDQRIGYVGLGVQDQGVQVRIREEARVEDAEAALRELTEFVDTNLFTGMGIRDVTMAVRDGNQIVLTLTQEGLEARIGSALEQSIEVVRRRIDALGTTEPIIQRQGTDRILVQVPGLDDPDRLVALLGSTAQLTFQMVDTTMSAEQALASRPPPDSEVMFSIDQPPIPYLIERRILVSGEDLVDAQASFDQRTGEPVVTFRFNSTGARRFANATQENVGRPFAIILDNEVISAPVIREPILGGTGQISGDFTVEQASDLAILLRAGALPAPLTILEQRSVGPGLGADSIAAGEIAALVGIVAVLTFMFLAYGLFGVFANIALLVNITVVFGILTLLQATLTLPGIAGIVLTVGMAVDANVLIYERIREEIRAGKSAIASIDSGFSKAFGTILDANITTLIAAVILFQLGSGPVRGFAVTLAVGIVTTVFTAILVNRLMVSEWVRWRRPSAVPI
ncbi:MAG: protein translocase subunit SecD [Pseudomonadota bacterium]